MKIQDFLYQWKTQTVALSGVGCISLIEFVKNFRTGCLIHTLSTIFNDKHHVAAGAVYMNRNNAVLWGKFDGIVDEIDPHFFQ